MQRYSSMTKNFAILAISLIKKKSIGVTKKKREGNPITLRPTRPSAKERKKI